MDPKPVLQLLSLLGIECELHEHPAVYTVREAEEYLEGMDHASHTKNLFLKDNKNHFYLLTAGAHQTFELYNIRKQIGVRKIRFASETELKQKLGLDAGSVSPFGLINDENHEVNFILTSKIWNAEKVAFHPNVNTLTIIMSHQSFQKVLNHLNVIPEILEV